MAEGAAEGEGRRGRDDGRLAEQLGPQRPADPQRRDPQPRRRTVGGGVDGAGNAGRADLAGRLGHGHQAGPGALASGQLGVVVLQLRRPVAVDLRARCVAGRLQQAEHVEPVPVQLLHPARLQQLQDALQAVPRVLEPGLGRGADQIARCGDRPPDLPVRQLVGQRVGHGGDELVGLVEHDGVALRQHLHTGEHVEGEQRVVGHDDIGLLRRLARLLAEAVDPVRAPAAEALPGADRHLAPGAVLDREGHLVPVAARGLARPLTQLEHLGTQAGGGTVEQGLRLVLPRPRTAVHLLQADVVATALRQRVRRGPAQDRGQGLHQARQVLVDELGLQCLGGGGHHDPLAGRERGHQVGQRLAGAGAGLHEQVLARSQRGGDRLDHVPLAGPLLRPRHGGQGGVERRQRLPGPHPRHAAPR